MNKPLTISAIAATALVGYAIYFDYNRRNSPQFRKSLKKKSIKHEKLAAKEQEQSKKSKLDDIKKALAQDLAENPIPTDLAEKEAFFMQQVALGEQLGALPDKKIEAAICFYKALAVYPNPTDILGIYQRSVPEEVYELVVMLIAVQPPASVTNILGGGASTAGASDGEKKPTAEDLD